MSKFRYFLLDEGFAIVPKNIANSAQALTAIDFATLH